MIILDTDVLIDVIDHRDPAFTFVAAAQAGGDIVATTSINAAEILRGVVPGTPAAHRVAGVLGALQEVPFGPAASRRFGTIMHSADRAGRPIPVVDGLIAAAALEAGGQLVTRNVRDFSRIAGLQVLRPG